MKYEVVTLLTDGNDTDGYYVNFEHNTGKYIEVAENASDNDIIDSIKAVNILKKDCDNTTLSVFRSTWYPMVVMHTAEWRPICAIRRHP